MQQVALFPVDGPCAGVDEAGRGPLAGPVVAAAVILHPGRPIEDLADSKKLLPPRREQLAREIRLRAASWAIAWADPAEIDAVNVLAATMLAMRRAIIGLHLRPGSVQVDGNRLPDLRFGTFDVQGEAIVGGDDRVGAISAASILAKTARDAMMVRLDGRYPGYDFAQHKGYGTRAHCEQLRKLGPCREHRQSFAPVREAAC